ncbi:MAG: hypothetical protein WDM70_05785 [Nitrosomonadales bacterium]
MIASSGFSSLPAALAAEEPIVGANVTHRVFAEIMKGGYIAQHMALPGARTVSGKDGTPEMFKSDVRCYVYEGRCSL